MGARLAIGLVLATLAAPTGAGQATYLIFGSEDLPEVPDATGDIQYHPLYVGSKDHAYLDFTAGWFEYDTAADLVKVTIRTADARNVGSVAPGWQIGCSVSGNLTVDGEFIGRLYFGWSRAANSSELVSFVSWERGQADFATDDSGLLPHDFEATLDEPGYFRVWVGRDRLQALGHHFETPIGSCYEVQPVPVPASTPTPVFNPAYNVDDAPSEAIYSFQERRQTRTSAGDVVDPIEQFERENGTAVPSSGSALTTEGKTPTLGAAVALLAIGASLLVLRRRQ